MAEEEKKKSVTLEVQNLDIDNSGIFKGYYKKKGDEENLYLIINGDENKEIKVPIKMLNGGNKK